MSKKIVLAADGVTATVTDATLSDILSTAINGNECVTGMYGFIQLAGAAVAGMSIQSQRKLGTWNPL